MRYRDRSILVGLWRDHKARQRYAAEDAAAAAAATTVVTLDVSPAPDTLVVVRTIRGYWRGCHPQYGHRWTRDITKAARYRSDTHAIRDATNTFLARETDYRIDTVPFG